MKNKNLAPIFVRSIFAITLFATVTYAQTVAPLPGMQPAEAESNLEISSALTTVTRESSAPATVKLFVVRLNDRLQLDLRTRKWKIAESTLDRKTSAASVEAEPESESPDPQPQSRPRPPATARTRPSLSPASRSSISIRILPRETFTASPSSAAITPLPQRLRSGWICQSFTLIQRHLVKGQNQVLAMSLLQ